MTISTSDNTPRISYSVSEGASQSSFAVPFEFFADADLNVYLDGTLKTISTHYSVSGGSGTTGSISMSVTGASGGSTVIITRGIALDRTTDFPTSGSFAIGTLNTELDRFVAIQADLNDTITRSVRLQDEDTAVSMELPLKADRVGAVLAFNASTGAAEAGPKITAVQSLSGITTSVNLLGTAAVVEDMGLLATSAVIEDMGLLATSANVTAMGLLGVSGVIEDMGILGTAAIVEDMGILATSANVTAMGLLGTAAVVEDMGLLSASAVIEDMGFLGTSANVTAMGVLGTSDNVTAMGALSASEVIADMALLATTDVIADMALLANSDVIDDLNTLATSDIVADLNKLATDDIVSDLNKLATTDIVNDLNKLATDDIVSDLNKLATDGIVADLNLLADNSVISDMATLAGSGGTPNITSVTASGAITAGSFVIGSADINENDLESIDGITAGTIAASKAAVVDANKDITGFRNITLTGELDAGSLDISGDIDVDGTANLDVVDIDGAVQIDNTVSVGVDDTGYDVKFFGDTASAFMLWDASADDLILGGAAGLSVNSAALVTGVLTTTAATVFNGGFVANANSTVNPTGGVITLGANGHITSKQSLDVATAGGRLIGQSNRGTVGQVRVEQTAQGADGGHVAFDTCASGSTTPSERMRINSSGNVSIGSTNNGSSGSMEVSIGSTSTSGGITLWSTTTGEGGINFGDGYSGTDRYRGSIAYNHSSDYLKFLTASSERMRIDSSGKVGIATSSPIEKLHVNGQLISTSSNSTGATSGAERAIMDLTSNAARVGHFRGSTSSGSGKLELYTDSVKRVNIDADGNVGIGALPSSAVGDGDNTTYIGADGEIQIRRADGVNRNMMKFRNSSNHVGSITTTSSATTYATSSDYRLKENVVTDWDATSRLKQLKPSRFNFIVDADTTVDGFLAHEAQAVVPECVTGTKDEVDDDGVAVMQGIDQSKLVPLLVKTIQELEARIATLEG